MTGETGAFPPKLFLIGAQKAGTTSLAYLLDQHPDIAVSNPKEPGFFTQHYEKGTGWYRNCFPADLPRLLVDASTGYTMQPVSGHDGNHDPGRVPRRIKAHSPDARFVYVLRDPVDRTISAYHHDRRAGRLSNSTLREAVSATPFYMDVSRYQRQIAPYLAEFPRERFLFVSFDELTRDPLRVARHCIEFAGLDAGRASLRLEEPKNAAFQFNGLGRLFFNLFPDERAASRFVGTAKSLVPPVLHRALKAAMTKQPDAVSDADRRWLSQQFSGDNRAMETLTGLRFFR
jgi:hypothetical protein